jgi:hypothetical protein
MSRYWTATPKRKLTKRQTRLAHKQARRLEKYKDHISEPYAIATYQVKKGYKVKP